MSKNVIFVLGMHRSGTSLIAKAVQILGANLGDNLMPPAEGNNPKGFWEDLDVNRLNDRILEKLDLAWDTPTVAPIHHLNERAFQGYVRDARRLLRLKLQDTDLIAVKDPRMCMLLPIWANAALEEGFEIRFVVVFRNPFDVAASLSVRDGFPINKSLNLWRNYNCSMLQVLSQSRPQKLVMRYDDMLLNPETELERLYAFMYAGGSLADRASFVTEFIDSYIDTSLCHSSGTDEGVVFTENRVSGLSGLFNLLKELLGSGWDDSKVMSTLEHIDLLQCELDNYKLERIASRKHCESILEQNRHKQGTDCQNMLREKENAHTERREHELKELAARLMGELRILTERKDAEMDRLREMQDTERETFHQHYQRQELTKNEEKARELKAQAEEFAGKEARLKVWYTERLDEEKEQYIRQLRDLEEKEAKRRASRAKAMDNERREHIRRAEGLEREAARYRGTVDEMNNERTLMLRELESKDYEITALRGSLSWRLTAPLRYFVRFATSLGRIDWRAKKPVELMAISGAEPTGDSEWRATNNDPALLVCLPENGLRAGWYTFEVEGNGLVAPEVFFDTGNDFNGQEVYELKPSSTGFARQIVLRQPVLRVRFDPCSAVGWFSIKDFRIHRRSGLVVRYESIRGIFRREISSGKTGYEILKEKWGIARKIGFFEVLRNFERYTQDYNQGKHVEEQLDYGSWISRVESAYFADIHRRVSSITSRLHLFIVLIEDPERAGIAETVRSVQDQVGEVDIWFVCTPERMEAVGRDWPAFRIESYNGYDFLFQAIKHYAPDLVTFVRQGWTLSQEFRLAIEDKLSDLKMEVYLLYTDHDRLNEAGERCDPLFNPDWSPDYFVEHDYVGGVLSFFGDLAFSFSRKLPKIEEPGAVPWALLTSVAAGFLDADVGHLPFILVHKTVNASDIPLDVRLSWLREFYQDRAHIDGDAVKGVFRVRYGLPKIPPKVSILTPTKDKVDLLKKCIETLCTKTKYPNFDVLVLDNGSEEERTKNYLKRIQERSGVQVIPYDKPFNFSAINNFGAGKADGELLCFLNNDTEIVDPYWLTELVSRLIQPQIGCVGVKLLYPNGKLQHGGVIVGSGGVAGHAFVGVESDASCYGKRLSAAQNYSAVTGACLVTRRKLFEELGGFNERFLAVAFNDIDYCLRVLENGQRVVWTPHTKLIHHESASRAPETERIAEFSEEIRFMQARWGRILKNDPAYNPHLTLTGSPFGISDRWLTKAEGNPADVEEKDALYGYESNMDRVRVVIEDRSLANLERAFAPGLTVIILNLEKPELIGPQLDSLVVAKKELGEKHDISIQILVGDTGSKNPHVWEAYERHFADVEVESDMRYQFSKCNNELFLKKARYNFVLFLNNDVVFDDATGQLLKLLEIADGKESVGILGVKLLYPDGRIQHRGVDIFKDGPLKGLCYHPRHGMKDEDDDLRGWTEVVPAVTGACLLINSELFVKCGGFDEEYQAEAQDVDLCLKARRLGSRSVVVDLGKVIHFENATRPRGEENLHDRARFMRKWARFTELMF